MRRTCPAGAALAVAACLILPALDAAASSSGTIQLRGVVPVVCTVSVAETGASLNLTQGQTDVAVASVREQCNAAAGYSVSITSRNGGQLRTDGGQSGVGYTLRYGDQSGAGQLLTDRSVSNSERTGTLSVTVPANRDLPAGEYTDIVTISVSAK